MIFNANLNAKGASMPMFAVIVPVIIFIMVAAINYQFYSSGESRLDAGTDRAVNVLAVNYTIEEFDERTLITLSDHLDGSTLDTLVEVSMYRASEDAIPGVPASGELPLECTQECIRFELDPVTGLYVKTVDAWPASTHNSCEEILVGITAVIDHANVTPLDFFEGNIASSKVERTQTDDTCIPSSVKKTVLKADYDNTANLGPLTSNPKTIPFQETEDNRNISLGNGSFLILEDGDYNLETTVLLDNPLPTDGNITLRIVQDGNIIGETIETYTAVGGEKTLTVRITEESLSANEIISVTISYDGTSTVEIDDTETLTTIFISQVTQE